MIRRCDILVVSRRLCRSLVTGTLRRRLVRNLRPCLHLIRAVLVLALLVAVQDRSLRAPQHSLSLWRLLRVVARVAYQDSSIGLIGTPSSRHARRRHLLGWDSPAFVQACLVHNCGLVRMGIALLEDRLAGGERC